MISYLRIQKNFQNFKKWNYSKNIYFSLKSKFFKIHKFLYINSLSYKIWIPAIYYMYVHKNIIIFIIIIKDLLIIVNNKQYYIQYTNITLLFI